MEKENTFFEDYQNLIDSFEKIEKRGKSNWGKHIHINDVLKSAKENCRKHNFILIQKPEYKLNNESGVNLLVTELLHKDGERIKGSIELVSKEKDNPQKLGGSITYMRRYLIVTMLGLEGDDDDGDTASAPYTPKKANESNPKGFMQQTSISTPTQQIPPPQAEYAPVGKMTTAQAVNTLTNGYKKPVAGDKCNKCGATMVLNPKTDKVFCEAKCFLN